jgi:hypothetical protein
MELDWKGGLELSFGYKRTWFWNCLDMVIAIAMGQTIRLFTGGLGV